MLKGEVWMGTYFKAIYFVLTLMFVSLCAACKDVSGYDTRLIIINNSDVNIFFSLGYTYPDTTIRDYNPTASTATFEVKAKSSKHYSVICCWESLIEDLPADILMIFVFDADTLEQVPWEEIRSEYKILKRYDLSLQDLKNMDWMILYP